MYQTIDYFEKVHPHVTHIAEYRLSVHRTLKHSNQQYISPSLSSTMCVTLSLKPVEDINPFYFILLYFFKGSQIILYILLFLQ